jgi:hypothetical protein
MKSISDYMRVFLIISDIFVVRFSTILLYVVLIYTQNITLQAILNSPWPFQAISAWQFYVHVCETHMSCASDQIDKFFAIMIFDVKKNIFGSHTCVMIVI